jgi:hypothetical protein
MCAGASGDGKAPPKFFGHLVPLMIGARYIDVAAWHRSEHNFYSGNAVQDDAAAAASARAAAGRAARAARIAPQTVSLSSRTRPAGRAGGGYPAFALRNLKVRYIMPLYICPNQGDLYGFQG